MLLRHVAPFPLLSIKVLAPLVAGVVVGGGGELGGEVAFGKMSSPRHQLLASKIKQTSFPPAWPVYWLLSGELSPTPLSVTEAHPIVLRRSLPGPPLSFRSYPSLLPLLHLCSLDPGTSPGDPPPTQTPSCSLFSLTVLYSAARVIFLIKIPVFISLLNLKSSNGGQA